MAKQWHVFRDAAGRSPFMRIDPQDGQNKPRRFRFSLAAGLAFEDEVGSGINQLLARGKQTTAIVKGLYHGFKWEDPALTEDKITGPMQLFVDQGGDVTELYEQMVEALNASGTFGRPKVKNPDPPPAGEDGAAGSAPEGPTAATPAPATE